MNRIDNQNTHSTRGKLAGAAILADFNTKKGPKEREAASKLLAFVAIKLAERDPETARGRMKSPTEYMIAASAYFDTTFPSRPFAFQRQPESFYRKALVPDFHSVVSERFIELSKHRQGFRINIVEIARDYYLTVLISKVRSQLSDHSEPEALGMLHGYITNIETTRERLASYLGRAEGAQATIAAETTHPQIYRLLAGWKELFDA